MHHHACSCKIIIVLLEMSIHIVVALDSWILFSFHGDHLYRLVSFLRLHVYSSSSRFHGKQSSDSSNKTRRSAKKQEQGHDPKATKRKEAAVFVQLESRYINPI
ncbi:hypothetical protein BJ912DRAFT_993756 [Pholiota molesta]|nr:hypothetical protein BJ912DRAFT_993756 [Pholiota molesta]